MTMMIGTSKKTVQCENIKRVIRWLGQVPCDDGDVVELRRDGGKDCLPVSKILKHRKHS